MRKEPKVKRASNAILYPKCRNMLWFEICSLIQGYSDIGDIATKSVINDSNLSPKYFISNVVTNIDVALI